MSNVARVGDLCDACPKTSPDVILSGEPTVLIEGVPAAHIGSPIGNGSVVVAGSATVTVGGIPLARIGDATSCGVIIGPGAGTVLGG